MKKSVKVMANLSALSLLAIASMGLVGCFGTPPTSNSGNVGNSSNGSTSVNGGNSAESSVDSGNTSAENSATDSSGGATSNVTLNITAVQLGYGLDWLTAIADEFTKDTGIKVKVTSLVGQVGNGTVQTEIESKSSDSDIFIYQEGDFFKRIYQGKIKVQGKEYETVFANLTDIYQEEYAGENGATLESKLAPTMLDYLKVNDSYYSVPWVDGKMGLVINNEVWDSFGLTDEDKPLTTNEMFAISDTINAKFKEKDGKRTKNAAFIYCAEDEYYSSVLPLWFYQYEGATDTAKWDAGLAPNGELSPYLYSYTGQKKALEVMEKLLKPTNGYQHKDSTNGITFSDMQGKFLRGQAAFCVNGAWLEREMKKNYPDANIEFWKVPVISSIVEELSFKELDAAAAEAKLVELIKYVDGTTTTKPEGVTDADIERVEYARKYSCATSATAHHMMASSYSKNLDEAKAFIKYVYSNKGMQLYYKALDGAQLPATLSNGEQYDSSVEVSNFIKSVNAISYDEVGLCPKKARVFALGGVDVRFNNNVLGVVAKLVQGKTASEIIKTNTDYLVAQWEAIEKKI